ncbi:hypothetical protein DL764_009736 [Monosporascus ibericus]|uniref:ER membrane protein complex subunit 2 n=1 Tax=Monosporascus ibericus TaxID=155417 RepID=A0A4Q4SU89_9PEZI|nr:hypothetical protein DL764_009736 [Monosporascus ibericus]
MTSSSLLRPPSHLPPATALKHSQLAPSILENTAGAVSNSTLQSLLAPSETPELWTTYENLLLSCLRTGDDEAAHRCLERLVKRFGDENERVLALKGLLKEAEAEDDATLEPITKRRVALLRSMGKVDESVSALISLLDFSPTDAEAWAELADLYFSQGLSSQAIFALEEVLVLQPNAWNIHARLGEVLLMAAKASSQGDASRRLSEALKRFCRSIELCDDYLRGYYGLKLTTSQLLNDPPKASRQQDSDGFNVPEPTTLQKLDAVATEKLAEIVRQNSAGKKGWQGYDQAEVAAARELLEDKSMTTFK